MFNVYHPRVRVCVRVCREILRSKIDKLLDEGLMLGPSRLATESLRPLACQVRAQQLTYSANQ